MLQKDLNFIWHPCSQMKDFVDNPPLIIKSAYGSYLYTDRGPIIDATSSWWCKSLGHAHPVILAAIKAQLKSFEHVIMANTTHPALVELGETLATICQVQHSFFASDGSSAVEIALKIALHAALLQGYTHKTEFIALQNAYHGETMAALSVSDLGLYKQPYAAACNLKCHFLQSIPYITDPNDLIWLNASEHWQVIFKQLEKFKKNACAIIIEPIIQGAGGMLCYSADFLQRLAQWAKQNNIYLIADEIMTGLGRTGKWLACEHASITPDIICLSKGLTAGTIALSCVLVQHELYSLFYDDYVKNKSFLHSHTYSGNALAVSAALATIKFMQEAGINEQATRLGLYMYKLMNQIASITGKLRNVRSIGAMVAADLPIVEQNPRIGYQVHLAALQQGALLRPLGNTIYWTPPLNTDYDVIDKLAEITLNSLQII